MVWQQNLIIATMPAFLAVKLTVAINFNLSGAYRVSNNFSIGAGVNAVYADAVVDRRVGVLGLGAALWHKSPSSSCSTRTLQQLQQYATMAQQVKSLDQSAILHKLTR